VSSTLDVRAAVESFADNPSAFLALNPGNDYFTQPDLSGVVVHRESGKHLVGLGGPFAPQEDYEPLLRRFTEYAAERRKHVVAIQLQPADAEVFARNGYTVNQVGASYAVDLARFTLRGSKFMRLRNKISRATKAGVTVAEESIDDPETVLALDALDKEWLRGKGRHVKPLRFLVCERDAPGGRVFVARGPEGVLGYIVYTPVHGSRPGWMHALSRRRVEVPPGVMELANKTAVEVFIAEGAPWLHFGFTPFAGLDPDAGVPGGSPKVDKLVRFFADHGDKVYPAKTQVDYKEKWGPHAIVPEYVAFSGRPRLSSVWRLLRVTNSV
jgi:lysylphosphatidylglycerol synthetase-like protein (DUF2156 family)